jgi:phosphoribosylaminoimidazolecarboxamide formyltransferase/IMP cyclohydrolase
MAFQKAWDSDPKSAYGSIVAFSLEVGMELCDFLKSRFIEVVIAPSFSSDFLAWSAKAKLSLRLLEAPLDAAPSKLYRSISGGMLVQTPPKNLFSEDKIFKPLNGEKIGVATKRQPLPHQAGLLRFAIAATQSIKSNAIVLAREYALSLYQLVGLGGGQPNRIDSLQRLAIPKAIEMLQKENNRQDVRAELGEVVLASDGFFPFADSVKAAADAGIQLFLQPGGSMRDEEVIREADDRGLCMIFTGQRYFSH